MRKILEILLDSSMALRKGLGLFIAVLMGVQVLWMAPALAVYVTEVPNLATDSSTWVADEAGVMSPITRRTVNSILDQIADTSGNEVSMVTIRGLNYGDSSQKFADDLFEAWFPDSESQANQTVLVLDSKTKTSGIRIGEASQAVLDDDLADSIASESLLIPVRTNNYNEAFEDTANRLAAIFGGEADPGAPSESEPLERKRNYKTAEETDDFNATILVVVMLIISVIVPMVTYYYYESN